MAELCNSPRRPCLLVIALMILFNLTSCLLLDCMKSARPANGVAAVRSLRWNNRTSQLTGWTAQRPYCKQGALWYLSCYSSSLIFYKGWNTWLCGLGGKKECGKHICVENTKVLTPGLCLTQRLSVFPLLCNALLGRVLGIVSRLQWAVKKLAGENTNNLTHCATAYTHKYHCCNTVLPLLKQGKQSPPPHFPTLPSKMIFKTALYVCVHHHCACVGQWQRSTVNHGIIGFPQIWRLMSALFRFIQKLVPADD